MGSTESFCLTEPGIKPLKKRYRLRRARLNVRPVCDKPVAHIEWPVIIARGYSLGR